MEYRVHVKFYFTCLCTFAVYPQHNRKKMLYDFYTFTFFPHFAHFLCCCWDHRHLKNINITNFVKHSSLKPSKNIIYDDDFTKMCKFSHSQNVYIFFYLMKNGHPIKREKRVNKSWEILCDGRGIIDSFCIRGEIKNDDSLLFYFHVDFLVGHCAVYKWSEIIIFYDVLYCSL